MKRFLVAFLLVASCAGAQTAGESVDAELSALRARVTALEALPHNDHSAEIAALEVRTTALEAQAHALPQAELDGLQAQIDTLNGQVLALQAQIADHEARIVALEGAPPPPPPPAVCGNGVLEAPEVCDGPTLGGETCASQMGAGWTGQPACAADCLSFDTSSCVPPSGGGVFDALAPYVPAPGEWAKIPNSEIGTVLHQQNEFPFSPDIWGFGSHNAFTAWNGMDTNMTTGVWWQPAGGGHNGYGGNEVYSFNFATLSWARETQPEPTTSCVAPATGPVSRHTYDGVLYVPSTNEILVGGSCGFCGNCMNIKVWVYSVATKTWRLPPSLDGLAAAAGMAYDAARDRIYVGRGHNTGPNRLRELDPQNDYAIVRDVGVAKQFDGTTVFDPVTRYWYGVGRESSSYYASRTHIALDGTIGLSEFWRYSDQFPPSELRNNSLALDSNGDLIVWHGGAAVSRIASSFDNVETFIGVGETPGATDYIYSKWFYVADHDVFVGLNDARDGVFLYRLPAGGTAFMDLCAKPGVILCDPLDTAGPFNGAGDVMPNPDGSEGIPTNANFNNWRGVNDGGVDNAPVVDASVKASGTGSLRFTIPSGSDSNDGGLFTTNFANDLSIAFGPGDTFCYRYRWRADHDFIYAPDGSRRFYSMTDGSPTLAKLSIVGTGDRDLGFPASSCSKIETVLTHGPDHYLHGYHGCPSYPGSHGWEVGIHPFDFEFQPGGASSCRYHNPPPNGPVRDWGNTGPDCFYLEPDQWMTFETCISIGSWNPDHVGAPDSNIKVWAAYEGSPLELVTDFDFWVNGPDQCDFWQCQDLTSGAGYGKIWLLPYMAGKDPAESHPETYIWYDELIVSTNPIEGPEI